MIEIKCDICKETVNRFQFYKLEQTICEIDGERVRTTDNYICDAPPLHSGMHLCETCINKLNGRIADLIGNSRQ